MKQTDLDHESEVISKGPCSDCGSSDACAVYSDSHTHCFSCGYHRGGTGVSGSNVVSSSRPRELLDGSFKALTKRGITEETCRKFGYQVGTYSGRNVHIAPYFGKDGMVAQKVRFPDKDFTVLGKLKDAGLFGQHLWSSGKKIVITEGEIDCLSVSQMQGNKWPTVSVPNGADGAKKAIAKQLSYLANFDQVIFMFDMDEPGQQAASECAAILPPGKAFIAHLSAKDPNELLMAGKGGEITNAIWNAKPYRPDGIVRVSDIKAKIMIAPEMGLSWFSEKLTEATYGRRYGEIYGLGAGTGIGKTDFFLQQICHDVLTLGQRVGLFFLEQPPDETVKRVAGKSVGKSFHVPDGSWTQDELLAVIDKLETEDRISMYDSFGTAEWTRVDTAIRFMAHSEDVRIFYLDHLTAMAEQGADERGSIEKIMKAMAMLAVELDVMILYVSHLATPDGKSHEEGGHVSIKHFKGARAIGFWSNFMFGLERDQQSSKNSTTALRILKDRNTGRSTGKVIYFGYDHNTSLMFETEEPGKYGFDTEASKGEEF